MTSGTFRTIPINSIVIDRANRQRRELVGIEELMDSIRTVGLINPPVVDSNDILIAGERRLTACLRLGWTSITVQDAATLDPAELHLIELEENVKRVDLSWQDQCKAMADYHALRQRNDPQWSQSKTAKALGVKDAEVSNRLSVAKALEEKLPLVVNADKYSVALGVVQRNNARKVSGAEDALKAALLGKPPAAPISVVIENDIDLDDDTTSELVASPAPRTPFVNMDFAEWARTTPVGGFNFLHCDFPYGVNAESHKQGAGQAFGTYNDSADVYFDLLNVLESCMTSIIAESAHMMFWFSMDYYEVTRERLTAMGWRVNPFPLIWHKSDNSGILPDPRRGPRRIYETAFLCSRGDRPVVQPVSNLFSAPNLKTIHMSEKNPEMLRHFFRMFVDNSTLMLDPTMGSGNAVVVAESMGASFSLGLERDEEFYTRATDAYIAGLTTPQV